MLIALTHLVSPRINECEVSREPREPIDLDRALKEHAAYVWMLQSWGLEVKELSVNSDFPDGTFIEDIAVVVDEIAVLTRPGAASRRGEVKGMEEVLGAYRKTARIRAPATLDGGDVLRMGKKIFTGISKRSTLGGSDGLREILAPFGYDVIPVKVKEGLHLKSACTALDDHTLLVNPERIDTTAFKEYTIVPVSEKEPEAANALRVKDRIAMHAGYDRTVEKVRSRGFKVFTLDISELIKAESGLTCSSIIFEDYE
jgi:dimethylargininase